MCKLRLKVWTMVPRSRTVSVSYLVEAGAAGRHVGILLRSDRQVRKKRQQGRSFFLELEEGVVGRQTEKTFIQAPHRAGTGLVSAHRSWWWLLEGKARSGEGSFKCQKSDRVSSLRNRG